MLPSGPQSEPGEPNTQLVTPSASDSPTSGDGIGDSSQEWAYLHILSIHSLSLEMRAAIIFPAEVLALLALWEHLYDFDMPVPRTFAWIAWVLLIAGIFVAGWLIAFAVKHDALPSYGVKNRTKMRNELHARVQVLGSGIRLSVVVSLVALGIAAIGYAIDKANGSP